MRERPRSTNIQRPAVAHPDRGSLAAGTDRRLFLRNSVLAGASLTALGPLLAACGTPQATASGSGGGKGAPEVGFLLRAKSQPRWSSDAKGFEAGAKSAGFSYLVDFLTQDDGSEQLTAATSMLQRGIKVLVFVPIDDPSSLSIAKAAKQQGVKVVGYDAEIGAGVAYDFQIERDNENVGVQIAQSGLGRAPKGNYLIVAGDQETNVAVIKRNGIMKALQPALSSGAVKVVSDVYNKNWDPSNAQVQVEGAIQKTGGNIAAVLCENDGMAVGCFSALKAAGLEKKVWLTGEDADLDRVRLIAEGYPGMSVYTPVAQMGQAAAKIAADLLKGVTPPSDTTLNIGTNSVPAQLIKTLVVDKSSIMNTVSAPGGPYPCASVYQNVPASQRPSGC